MKLETFYCPGPHWLLIKNFMVLYNPWISCSGINVVVMISAKQIVLTYMELPLYASLHFMV